MFARSFGIFVLAASLGVIPSALSGEPPPRFVTRTLGIDEGLPDLVVTAIRQTRDGYLWIGTENGLARFDGNQFVVFQAADSPGLGHNTIRSLFEDAEGTLWIGTQTGLSRLKAGKLERMLDLGTPVTAVLVDGARRIWVGTRGQGLSRFENGTLIKATEGLAGSGLLYVRSLFEDSRGRIWVGFGAGTPACIENQTPRRVAMTLDGPGVSGFAEYPRGTLWMTSGSRLLRATGNDETAFSVIKPPGSSEEALSAPCVSPDGHVYCASGTHLWRVEASGAEFADMAAASLSLARHVSIDREGNCWIGSTGQGLSMLRPSAFEQIHLAELTGENPCGTLAADRNGVISLGLRNGVIRLAPDGSTVRIDSGQTPGDEVLSVFSSRDGRLWIGRRGTLLVWEDGRLTEFPEARSICALFEDSVGDLWLGSINAGILRIHGGQLERMNSHFQLRAGVSARTFAEVNGALYIGLLTDGLVEIHEGKLRQHFHVAAGTPLDMIRSLKSDADGNLWIGTRGAGLALLSNGRVWSAPPRISPFRGPVSAIEFDDHERVFVGSSLGLMWAPRKAVVDYMRGRTTESPFQRAGESDGLRPSVVGFGQYPASTKGPQGRIWFATHGGLVAIAPDRIASNLTPPVVHILGAMIADRPAEIVDEMLVIPPGRGAIRIDYTATSFTRPDLTRFRYRMEDLDHGWSDVESRHITFHNNLPPGAHRLQVIAANESGRWNSNTANLLVIQKPYYYQTLWFRAGLIAVAALTPVFVIRQWARRKLQRTLDALESERRLHRERTRIARDIHDEIGSSVTKIGYLVERLDPKAPPEASERVRQQLSQQTRLLVSDLDRVVWSVSPENGTLARLATFVVTYAKAFLQDTSVSCDVHIPASLPEASISPEFQHHVLAITKEAINNSIKHARARHIELRVTCEDDRFVLSISDDGCGFEVDAQANSERNGLSNMRTRGMDLGGQIDIVSAPGAGTSVTLALPLPRRTSPAAS